jgi:TPR repeat protein
MARARPVSMTETELKKMRWVIQMLVFTLHYGMPLHLDRVCLEDYMNREGHSVRTYAEKYIYPEVFTTPNQMYDFGLEYLYGTGRAWEKDVVIARTWLEKAAAKGHVGAQTQLRLLG